MKRDYKIISCALLLVMILIMIIASNNINRVSYGPYYDKDMNLVEFNVETGEWNKVNP